MSQPLHYELEDSSINPPTPQVPTNEALNTESEIVDSSNTQKSITTVSNSSRELPQERSTQEFPQYNHLPQEIKWEILYQAARQIEARIIPVNIETRLLSPTSRRPSDKIEAYLNAGGKWKIQNNEFQRLTLTRGCGWHSRDSLTLDQFYFRPEKDILWFSEECLENYQNIRMYPSGSVRHLGIGYRDLRTLLVISRGQVELDSSPSSSLFIGKLRNLEYVYVVPGSSKAMKEKFNENSILVDSGVPNAFFQGLLRLWWVSWLEKDPENVDWKAPELFFKQFGIREVLEV